MATKALHCDAELALFQMRQQEEAVERRHQNQASKANLYKTELQAAEKRSSDAESSALAAKCLQYDFEQMNFELKTEESALREESGYGS